MTLIKLPVRSFRFYPAEDPLGVETKSIEIETQRTALLLVDVYHAAESQQARHLVNTTWDNLWWKIVDECLVPLVASPAPSECPSCTRQTVVPISRLNARHSVGH